MMIESLTGVYHDERDRAKGNIGVHLVSFFTIFFILIVETSYSQSLFDSSIDFIAGIQEGASDAKKTIWGLYSNLGIACVVGVPPFVYFLVFWDRLNALVHVIFLTAMLLVMNLTKLFYH